MADARRQGPSWCVELAGKREHGTTHQLPLVVFIDEERAHLLPYDGVPWMCRSGRTSPSTPITTSASSTHTSDDLPAARQAGGALRSPRMHRRKVASRSNLVDYTTGFVQEEYIAAARPGSPTMKDDPHRLPTITEPQSYPHIAQMGQYLIDRDGDARFAFGLRIILNGLEQRLARRDASL